MDETQKKLARVKLIMYLDTDMKTKVTLVGNFICKKDSARKATAVVNFGGTANEVMTCTMSSGCYPESKHVNIIPSMQIKSAIALCNIELDLDDVCDRFVEFVIKEENFEPKRSKYQQKRKDYRDDQAQELADKIIAFAKERKLRKDWHKSDEQGVSVSVTGFTLDNAFGDIDNDSNELLISLYDDDNYPESLVTINLANLFACVCYLAEKE